MLISLFETEMVDLSYVTFVINLILNLAGSKQCIVNVFIFLIARIVFKAPTEILIRLEQTMLFL